MKGGAKITPCHNFYTLCTRKKKWKTLITIINIYHKKKFMCDWLIDIKKIIIIIKNVWNLFGNLSLNLKQISFIF